MAEIKSEEKSRSETDELEEKNSSVEVMIPGFNDPVHVKEVSEYKKKIRQFLQNIYFQVFITVISLFSLYSDDIRTAATDASADVGFDTLHIIFITIFTIEIVLNFISIDEYRFSFFFVLDVVSCLTILLDVSMVTAFMYQNNTSTYNLGKLAGQSRASRVATRAVRIVKLVRIIRIIKLYKAAMRAKELKEEEKRKRLEQNRRKNEKHLKTEVATTEKKTYKKTTEKKIEKKTEKKEKEVQQNQEMNEIEMTQDREVTAEDFIMHHNENLEPRENKEQHVQIEENKEEHKEERVEKEEDDFIFDAAFLEEMSQKESKISQVMSDLTVKKVIISILLMMFLIPLFNVSNYEDKCESWDYITTKIRLLLMENNTVPLETISGYINQMILEHSDENYIIYVSTPYNELPLYSHDRYGKERVQDITISVEVLNHTIIMEARPQLTMRSNLEDYEKTKIYTVMNYHEYNKKCALFSIGRTTFICIILIVCLQYFAEDINELIVSPIEKMMKQVMEMAKNPESVTMTLIDNTQYETAIVHNAIVKIGALLSLVFGSAGAEIIGSNIMKEGDMNPLIGGKKKCAIFGFCNIRNFTEVTELLHEDIMLFVNKIGELVHSSVYRYGGSANKNIGEAFLMVWQLPHDSYKINNKTNEITWKKHKHINLISDFSILSFIKAIVKINKDPTILEYRNDKRLIESNEFKNNGYQVKMGFGLHIGWAIEGAIGSEYKIDASYLSPNVNMASRLEAATKQYGVNILISEDLYEMSTPEMKKFCRNIDRVTVKGSAKPIRLYTIDLRLENISPPMDKALKYKNPEEMLDVEIKREINMEYFEDDKIDTYNAEEFIRRKKELREVMIDATSEEFRKRYELGLDCYLAGKWSDAKLHLGEATKYGKNDGPTKNLLNYMKKFEYVAPETWKNYRPLTEK